MMKKILTLVSAALCSLCLWGQADSTDRYAGLDSLLTQFYTALERESVEAKNAEFDRLIGTCTDSLLRQHVTLKVFKHYKNSRVMGEEAVAVHVYDKWIDSGLVKTKNEFEQMEAELFVNFNKYSLIGMKAPEVTLKNAWGFKEKVPAQGRISVFFFYSTSCMKCMIEAPLLPPVLEEVDFPMDFYAVYTEFDRRDWKAFRRNFKVSNKNVRVKHLWDPDSDSDYPLMYAVNATPRIFVIWKDGEIIGRRLEVENLKQIISYIQTANGKEKAE